MILKLTSFKYDTIFIVDTIGCYFGVDLEGIAFFTSFNTDSYCTVKETLEEIIQQIKEGGITNGTN